MGVWSSYTHEFHSIMVPFHSSGSVLPPVATDQFPHVSMDATSGPTRGVLRRHLIAAHMHHARGAWSHPAQPLVRLIRWVGDIWTLYSKFVRELELMSMATGQN